MMKDFYPPSLILCVCTIAIEKIIVTHDAIKFVFHNTFGCEKEKP